MHIPNTRSHAPNPKRVLALGLGIWVLGFGISISAQSPYVAGAIGADVSRVGRADSSLYPSPSNGTEVLSGALRVGTFVGSNWGVELEFVRSGRTNEQGAVIRPLALAGSTSAAIAQVLPPGVVPNNISFPVPFDYRSDVGRRHASVDAVAWARRSVSGSVDLVYLGGVAFSRDRSDITESVTPVFRTLAPPATGVAVVAATTFRSTLIQYDTRPLVGMEARIGLTSKLRLVPGLRLQGLRNGWLLRPYVGLGWFF
jgi:hypothetical protein